MKPWGRLSSLLALTIFVAALAVYLATLAPTLTWAHDGADGGDLITATWVLGVPHPPGYPTYVLLGRLFLLWPLGDPAYRLNLMSAVAAAGAVTLVYLIAIEITAANWRKHVLAATAGSAALTFAFSPLFWSQAVIAEVYALNALFAALVIYLLLRWQRGAGWGLPLAALALGLGLGNHLTLAFVGLIAVAGIGYSLSRWKFESSDGFCGLCRHGKWGPLFCSAWTPFGRKSRPSTVGFGNPTGTIAQTTENGRIRKFVLLGGLRPPRNAGHRPALSSIFHIPSRACFHRHPMATVASRSMLVVACFLVGLTVYLYLPWSAAQAPPVNWGDPRTLDRFWWVVSGALYRGYLFTVPLEHIPARLAATVSLYIQQFGPWGAAISLLGLWWLWGQRRALAGASLTGVALYTVYAMGYNTPTSYVYLIPAFLAAAVWLAAGLQVLAHRWPRLWPLALLLPALALVLNVAGADLHADYAARDYAQAVWAAVEPQAIIVTGADEHTFALWYAQLVAGQRPDVVIVDRDLLAYDWHRAGLARRYPDLNVRDAQDEAMLITAHIAQRPIYLTDRPGPAGYELAPAGPIWRVESPPEVRR